MSKIIYVDIEDLRPNKYQPRKNFSDTALEELGQSIKEYGIIQPITIRRLDNAFEIVAGERRYRASKLINLKKVPCLIVDITNTESAELALLENLQREDLNFIEEAQAYSHLINEHSFTQEKIANRMGKKQSTIANKLRLLKLSENIRRLCIENKLTERHTRALLKLKEENIQEGVIKKVIKDKLSVKQTEEVIKRIIEKFNEAPEEKNAKNIKLSIPTKIYINSIKEIFEKFNIEANYDTKEEKSEVKIIVTIPKVKK